MIRLRAGDARLPVRLGHLPDPPPRLFLRAGDADALLHVLRRGPVVALVGTRRATAAGRAFARALGEGLVRRGALVVSGLALGIDAAAHEGALAGGGPTLAVLASGVDEPTPARNARLAERIAARGGLLSEYPPGTTPARWRFPARNRLISALAHGVVVIEAPQRSGALITADIALDLGRAVCAVPGPPWSQVARGCNALIRAGAAVCEGVEDVVAEMPGLDWSEEDPPAGSGPDGPGDPFAARILGVLGSEPLAPDQIADRLGSAAPEVMAALAALEVEGMAVAVEGGRYAAPARPRRRLEDPEG